MSKLNTGRVSFSVFFVFVFSLLTLKDGADKSLLPFSAELSILFLLLSFVCVLVWRRFKVALYLDSYQWLGFFLLVCLFFLALFSSFWSKYLVDSVVRSFLFICAPIIFLLLVFFERPEPSRIVGFFVNFSVALVAVGLFLLTVGNIEYVDGAWVNSISVLGMRISQPYYSNNFRLASLVGNANLLGLYASVSLGLCFWLRSTSNIRSMQFYLYVVLLVVGVLLSQSRAAIGFALGAGSVGVFLLNKLTFARVVLSISICISFIVGMFFYIITRDSFSSRVASGMNERDLAWNLIGPRIPESPFFGHGFGSVTEYLSVENGLTIGAHSLYYTLAYELGLVGCFIFFALILVFLLHKIRVFNRPNFIIFFLILLFLGHQIVEVQLLKFNLVNIIFVYLCFMPIRFGQEQSIIFSGKLMPSGERA